MSSSDESGGPCEPADQAVAASGVQGNAQTGYQAPRGDLTLLAQ